MELISWSLNAIDKKNSTRNAGSGEPICPDGTFAAGYMMDTWDKWRVVRLALRSVEDIEDIYLFSFMITGHLLLGVSTDWPGLSENCKDGSHSRRPKAARLD